MINFDFFLNFLMGFDYFHSTRIFFFLDGILLIDPFLFCFSIILMSAEEAIVACSLV